MARVGNSEEYFIGPESPGVVPNPGNNQYKDAQGLIKPQAARFRVYGYDENDNIVMEITHDPTNNVNLQWDVHVRNLKAANYAFQGKFAFDPTQLRNPGVAGSDPNERTSLIIDPGQKSISGISLQQNNAVQLDGGKIFDGIGKSEIPASLINKGQTGTIPVTYTSKEVSLGRLETDENGRLIFVGGKGDAGCLIDPPVIIQKGVSTFDDNTENNDPNSNGNSYFNNPGWYDDTSGGTVNASVTYQPPGEAPVVFSTNNAPAQRGWVAVSPPKYVPSMNNVVSLLDLQLDMFPEQDPVSGSLYFALLDSNGLPNIANGMPLSSLSFSPLSGVTQAGQYAPSIASFNDQYYLAYTRSDGNNMLAVSADAGVTWSASQIGSITTSYAPSLCVFNGLLTYVVTNCDGYLQVGTSSDGNTFSFISASPTGGVQAPQAYSAPSACGYNGSLFIAFNSGNNTLSIAQKQPKDSNLFTYTSLTTSVGSPNAPSICYFFGQLYCAYTGTDNQSYIGSYNNFAPQPAVPVINFAFTPISGAPATHLSPAISASHGQLYYTLIDTNSNVNIASGKPGFSTLSFAPYGTTTTSYAPAVANFSSISFYRDIYPTLKTVTDYAWVNEPAFTGHAPGSMGDFLRGPALDGYSNPNTENNQYRTFVFNAIRPAEQLTPLVPPPPASIPEGAVPKGGVQSGRLMPHLFGEGGSDIENSFNNTDYPNQWLSLTPHQLWKFQEWVNGNFQAGTEVEPIPLDQLPLAQQPAALDFSSLEPTVGGGFHPGIELTYYMKIPGFFTSAFRFADNITDDNGQVIGAITPGSVSGYMSIPWQGDFWSCNISWWAAMRPDIVVTARGSNPPQLSHKPWFRGEAVGIPPNADSIDGYEGGYEHMARYWSYFGFVVPNGKVDSGMMELAETERAACLDSDTAPCSPVNPNAPAYRVQLGIEQAATPSSGTFPNTFYKNAIKVAIPANSRVILAGSEDGRGTIYVDDEVIVKVNGTQVFSFDFSHGNSGRITPTGPVDITDQMQPYLGTYAEVTIEYVDLYPGSHGGSNFWLFFQPYQLHIGESQNQKPTSSTPNTFYSNTINFALPSNGKVILSGTSDGNGNIFVDDQVILKINGQIIYSHDYSNGNSGVITPTAPVDLTGALQAYLGSFVEITIEYVDLYKPVYSASDFWLVIQAG